jgi:hypothetical protein
MEPGQGKAAANSQEKKENRGRLNAGEARDLTADGAMLLLVPAFMVMEKEGHEAAHEQESGHPQKDFSLLRCRHSHGVGNPLYPSSGAGQAEFPHFPLESRGERRYKEPTVMQAFFGFLIYETSKIISRNIMCRSKERGVVA